MTESDGYTVEVAAELRQPLATLADHLQRSSAWIVNQALEEYLERHLGRHHAAATGSRSSYVELTAREDAFDFL